MSATNELRRLLDERGVEWHHTSGSLGVPYTWWHSPTMGEVDATEGEDGKLYIVLNLDLTPEQAIDATLGRGTCHVAAFGFCSECGARMDGIYQHYCPNCGRMVVE